MAVTIERKADFHILVFSAELSIFSVRDDFDSAGLQLLLYLRQQLQSEQPLRWLGLDNPVISKVLTLFRLDLTAMEAC